MILKLDPLKRIKSYLCFYSKNVKYKIRGQKQQERFFEIKFPPINMFTKRETTGIIWCNFENRSVMKSKRQYKKKDLSVFDSSAT